MPAQLSLILSQDPVPRATLRGVRGRSPSVAVVYATAAGEVDVLDGGKPMTYSGQFFSRYRTRYEIDLSDQHRTAELRSSPPPARDGAHFFDATLSVHFRVTDPAQIVVLKIRDGLAPVYDYLIDTCRSISREFDIEAADGVEKAINEHFRRPRPLPVGITIFACTARILPDRAALAFLDQRREAIRDIERKAAQDMIRLREEQVLNALEKEKQHGKLQREADELLALGDHPITAGALLRLELARHPERSGELLDKVLELQREAQQYQLQVEREHRELAERDKNRGENRIELLANRNLVKPSDVAHLLPRASDPAPAQVTASAVSWDDPLPVLAGGSVARARPAPPGPPVAAVVPVYIVVEQSMASSTYIDEVNAALTATVTTLGQAGGGVSDVVRLSVIGYSETADVQMPLQQLMPRTAAPKLSSRGQAHYAGAFQQLLTMIPQDVQQLKAQIPPVYRPLVFFLAGAPPVDGTEWSDPHTRLLDPEYQPYPPEIIAGGIAGLPARTVASIASLPQYAFVSTDTDLGQAVRQYFSYITQQIQARAQAVLQGRADSDYRRPEGFRMANEPV